MSPHDTGSRSEKSDRKPSRARRRRGKLAEVVSAVADGFRGLFTPPDPRRPVLVPVPVRTTRTPRR